MFNQGTTSTLSRDLFCILGLPFDAVNLSEASSQVNSDIDKKQRCFLTTPNLNFLITAQSDLPFFQSIVDSDLIIADGMPIIWIAKLLGIPFSERVAGSDLFYSLSNNNAQNEKTSVFFFGGQEGIAEQASQNLNKSSKSMSCCGFFNPGFTSVEEMSSPEIIELINTANPDFLVVSLGAEKGQAWIKKNKDRLNARIISHLGAVINFVAGSVARAPVFWQKNGLEWLWRIKQEPGLWKRYFFDGVAFLKLLTFKVILLALYDRWLKKSKHFNIPASVTHSNEVDQYRINLTGSINHAELISIKQVLINLLHTDQKKICLDCSGLTYIDSAFIGTLMLFQHSLNKQDRQLFLHNLPKRIIRLLTLNNVLNRFQFN